jgi:uncharacterized membrane protein
MGHYLILWLSTIVPFLALDFAWLSFAVPRFYRPMIGHLMAGQANFFAAAIFYVLYAAGVVFFVVRPAEVEGWSLVRIFLSGAFLGLLMYATYDLTNQATLKDWPWMLTGMDLLWGAFLTGMSSLIASQVARTLSI